MRVKFTFTIASMCLAGADDWGPPRPMPRLAAMMSSKSHRNGGSTRKEPDGGSSSSCTTMGTAVIIDAGSETITITFSSGGSGLPIAVDGDCGVYRRTAYPVPMALTLRTMTIRASEPSPSRPTVDPNDDGLAITVSGVRVDVSSLDVGDNDCGHHLDLGPFRFDSRRPVETRIRQLQRWAWSRPAWSLKSTAASRLICNLDATVDANG